MNGRAMVDERTPCLCCARSRKTVFLFDGYCDRCYLGFCDTELNGRCRHLIGWRCRTCLHRSLRPRFMLVHGGLIPVCPYCTPRHEGWWRCTCVECHEHRLARPGDTEFLWSLTVTDDYQRGYEIGRETGRIFGSRTTDQAWLSAQSPYLYHGSRAFVLGRRRTR